MNLKILLPAEVIVSEKVAKVVAEAANGFFCLLPHHVDYTAALVPGVFLYETEGEEKYLAVDVGTLVKKGDEILVSVRNAVKGAELGELKMEVVKQFQELDEREKKARSAAAKLEVDLLRRFIELRET
ncbi:MAG TPA: F0F1 ATP synthase subunit epsilon [Syntrophales bacterium]|nr:F0F1 ATP synthase subunit epsilon [Syntrophales bacterium]